MRIQTKIKCVLMLTVSPFGALWQACNLGPGESTHERVYQELTKTVPEQFRVANILATNDSIAQPTDSNTTYMAFAAEGLDFITWATHDTTPQPCPPPKPACVLMALDDRLSLSGRDSVFAWTSFEPDTSFQTQLYNVEVMMRALPQHVQGARSQRVQGTLLSLDKVLPGERLYIMKITPR